MSRENPSKFRLFWRKVFRAIRVWGKSYIRREIKEGLAGKLKKKINAGAIDPIVDKAIDKICGEFAKRL